MRASFFVLSLILLAACAGHQKGDPASKKEQAKASEREEKSVEKKSSSLAGKKGNKDNKNKKKTASGEATMEQGELKAQGRCLLRGDERLIQHRIISDNKCAIYYEKFGNRREVASGSSYSDHCGNVFSRIQARLEEAGFICQ